MTSKTYLAASYNEHKAFDLKLDYSFFVPVRKHITHACLKKKSFWLNPNYSILINNMFMLRLQ